MDFSEQQLVTVQCTDEILKVPLDIIARLEIYSYDLYPPGSTLPLNICTKVLTIILNIEATASYHSPVSRIINSLLERDHHRTVYKKTLYSLGSVWLTDQSLHADVLAAAHLCGAHRTLWVILYLVIVKKFNIQLLFESVYRDQLPDLVAMVLHLTEDKDREQENLRQINYVRDEFEANGLDAEWAAGIKLAVEIEAYSEEYLLTETHADSVIRDADLYPIESDITPNFVLRPYQLVEFYELDDLSTKVAEYEVILRHPINSDHQIRITPSRVEFKSELDQILLSRYFRPQTAEVLGNPDLTIRTNQFEHIFELVNYWGTFTIDIDVTYQLNEHTSYSGTFDKRFGTDTCVNTIKAGISSYTFRDPNTSAELKRIVSLYKAPNKNIVYPDWEESDDLTSESDDTDDDAD